MVSRCFYIFTFPYRDSRICSPLAAGALSSLKNRKQDATEMRKGTECGMGFEGWTDFKVGDQIQSYEEKVEKRTL